MNVVGAFFKYQVNNFNLPLTQILLQDSLAHLGEPSLTGAKINFLSRNYQEFDF